MEECQGYAEWWDLLGADDVHGWLEFLDLVRALSQDVGASASQAEPPADTVGPIEVLPGPGRGGPS